MWILLRYSESIVWGGVVSKLLTVVGVHHSVIRSSLKICAWVIHAFIWTGMAPRWSGDICKRQETCQQLTLCQWGRRSVNGYFSWLQLIWFLSCKIKWAGPLYKLAQCCWSTCWVCKQPCNSNDLSDNQDRHHDKAFSQLNPCDPCHQLQALLKRFAF